MVVLKLNVMHWIGAQKNSENNENEYLLTIETP